IRGAISSGVGGSSTPVFTLPAGFRPTFPHLFIGVSSVATDSTPQYFRGIIKTNGDDCIENISNKDTPNQLIDL
ncbi:hypothetical protein FO489_23270, partial [Bacillus licheniformis]